MAAPPDISVVIPTRNRWPALRRTLEALGSQQLGGLETEVVVVDNGSDDAHRIPLAEAHAAAAFPFDLEVLDEPVPGAGAARNAGVQEAAGRLVLFLGDDCLPSGTDFVAGHAAAHEGGPGGWTGVVGHTDWDPSVGETPVMNWLTRTGKQFDFQRAATEPAGPYLFYTNNLSLQREAVLAVGGFDERFGAYGWEDYELGVRLEEAGFRLSFRPDLRVLHAHRYEVRGSLARMANIGRTAALLNSLRPDLTPAPQPTGVKGWGGRALAPVLTRIPPPPLPRPLADRWRQAAHYAALARGYGAAPLRRDEELAGRIERPRFAERPAVSVIVPVGGGRSPKSLDAGLARLKLRNGDEIVLVDNTEDGVGADGSRHRWVRAAGQRSSYYARNVGVASASNDWLLFLDDDCAPRPHLLDEYFAQPPAEGCGAVAGAVVAAAQDGRIPRYSASRGYLSQAQHMRHPHRPFGVTANLLVRREAWESVGGFQEGLRSGGDADFSWRLQAAGWELDLRPRAAVVHRHRDTLSALMRQARVYGAGRAWLARRHPGAEPRPPIALTLARAIAAAGALAVTARFERALFKLVDAAVLTSENCGFLLSNAGEVPSPSGEPRVCLLVDLFPELSETFVAGEARALAGAGAAMTVIAGGRPERPNVGAGRGLAVRYLEDHGPLRKLGDVVAVVARHPVRCARDLAARRRWRREDEARSLRALAPAVRRLERDQVQHLHVHFAGTAALDALRIGAILGVPYSVVAHAWEIFRSPRNLAEKLRRAAFSAGESGYATDRLREVAGPGHEARIHHLPAGVELGAFTRHEPHGEARVVLAVGRLVEKKGFADLLEAVGRMDPDEVERVDVVGDGPLLEELTGRAAALGIGGRVRFLGARPHAEVRELLEGAAVLAMPSVVAEDGDRDSMPNVVYEAMAMEVPVVATDVAGLPEVVRPEWGRIVPERDPDALATALSELLGLPAQARADMGRAARAWLARERDAGRLGDRLLGLIVQAQSGKLNP